MYSNLKKFLERGKDQVFIDALVAVILVEIKIKSGVIDENLILKSSSRNCVYDGELYKHSAQIKTAVPPKVINEIKNLLQDSLSESFESYSQIKNWLVEKVDISHCSLSVNL